jgi:hypothetical protein
MFFGELSAFFVGFGGHLRDLEPVEILTLVPLATLVVAFGVQPGLLLDLFAGSVTETLDAAAVGAPIAVPGEIVVIAVAVLVVAIGARIAWALLPGRGGASPESGAPVAEGGAAH